MLGLASGPFRAAPPPSGAAEAMLWSSKDTAVLAWRRGRLYGLISIAGDARPALAARRFAERQDARFAVALSGRPPQASDDLLTSTTPTTPTPAVPPSLTTVAATTADGAPPTLSRPEKRSLASLGFGDLRFSPASGTDGLALPIRIDLPRAPNGRWFWWVDLHAVIELDAGSAIGRTSVVPRLATVGGPGPEVVAARDPRSGELVLVDVARRRAGSVTIEVRQRAVLGGSPDPRQTTQLTFSLASHGGVPPRLPSVTICGDTTIELAQALVTTGSVVQQPKLPGSCP